MGSVGVDANLLESLLTLCIFHMDCILGGIEGEGTGLVWSELGSSVLTSHIRTVLWANPWDGAWLLKGTFWAQEHLACSLCTALWASSGLRVEKAVGPFIPVWGSPLGCHFKSGTGSHHRNLVNVLWPELQCRVGVYCGGKIELWGY